jgi:hypothetical protein
MYDHEGEKNITSVLKVKEFTPKMKAVAFLKMLVDIY